MNTNDKLQALRNKMKEAKVDVYYVPTADPHMSEYVTPAYQARAWLSGFTGSAGQAVVSQSEAKVWTDGRYYIQAAKELAGSEFTLMKAGTPHVPKVQDYLLDCLPEKGVLAANGWTIAQKEVDFLQSRLREGQTLRLDLELVEAIWTDRPELPHSEAFLLDEKYSGRRTQKKLEGLREALADEEADYALIGKLDDIAWLYNIRGGDVKSTPVLLSYALVGKQKAYFFVDDTKLGEEVRKALETDGVEIRTYEEISDVLSELNIQKIWLDKRFVNAAVYRSIPEQVQVVDKSDWTSLEKALKNTTEIANQKVAYIKDGIAVTRLMHWLKSHEDISSIDELGVSRTLLGFREELEHFIEESFTTIAAYGANAAMMHYAPTEGNKANLQESGFLLVDSGGQYLEGTTDTTRTFALGTLTDEEKTDYTLCLKGHIGLARAVFLKGTPGYYLDSLARQPLWQHRMDYKSGTGHGVGYLLSVHEGPHGVSRAYNSQALEPGMVVTNEPGVYKEGKHGIRLENTYYVVEDQYVEPDQYLAFENFTMVPFDRDAIDVGLLERFEIEWVNSYHTMVYETLKSYVSDSVRTWLEQACAPIA